MREKVCIREDTREFGHFCSNETNNRCGYADEMMNNDNLPERLQKSECESSDQKSFRSHMLHIVGQDLPQGISSFQRRIRERSLPILSSGI